jgi:hypothetical protein
MASALADSFNMPGSDVPNTANCGVDKNGWDRKFEELKEFKVSLYR